jgi:L,D-transpeptidase catalytic domain
MRGLEAGARRTRRVVAIAVEAALLSLGILILSASSAARAAVLIEIDKSTQEMTVSTEGRLLWRWPVSTGRPGHDTPNGSFRTFRMEEDHYS